LVVGSEAGHQGREAGGNSGRDAKRFRRGSGVGGDAGVLIRGATQEPPSFPEFTSLKVGREPQEGRCPRVAPLGYTDSSVIETLWRPMSRGPARDGALHRNAREESTPKRARHGEEKALERKLGRCRPATVERSWRAVEVRENPRSVSGRAQGRRKTAREPRGSLQRRG